MGQSSTSPQGTPSAEDLQTIRRREAYVEGRLTARVPEPQIVQELMADGMTEAAARDFVRRVAALRPEAQTAAASKAGNGHLIWGFLLLAVGAGITIGTWKSASAGGSYWVMWGAMVWGIIHLIIGFSKKISNAANARARQMWIGGGALLAIGVVAGGIATVNMIMHPGPSADYIVMDSDTGWTTPTSNSLQAAGTIQNTHGTWSIRNVEIRVEGHDVNDKVVETFTVAVTPSTLGPGQSGTYSKVLTFPASCVSAREGVFWEWVPP